MSCPERKEDAELAASDEPAATSIDAFMGGRFFLVQPKGRGHRAGADALLLAAAAPLTIAGSAADLGAGTGAVGLALAARNPGLTVVLAERNSDIAALARQSLALRENAALASRLSVMEADVTARRPAREAAGLFDGSFDLVASNPPFHPVGRRDSPDALRTQARMLPEADFLERWIRSAAALLKPGGLFGMIARPDNLPAILVAAENRLGDMRIMPVLPREGKAAIRIILLARKGSRAPLSLLPSLILHREDGAFTPLAEAIFRGEAGMDFGTGA